MDEECSRLGIQFQPAYEPFNLRWQFVGYDDVGELHVVSPLDHWPPAQNTGLAFREKSGVGQARGATSGIAAISIAFAISSCP